MARHDVGDAIAASARIWWSQVGDAPAPTKDQAMAILEVLCGPWEGRDVRFDGGVHPTSPLGRLVAIAFDATPGEVASADADDDPFENAWLNGPRMRFHRRFDLW